MTYTPSRVVLPRTGEIDLFIASDGTSYLLGPSASRHVLGDEGSGIPEIEYVTQRGVYQDGESVTDYFLRPRIVQFHLRQKFCSRDEYWDGRAAILDAFRPNRGLNGVLRKVFPDGTKRDLTVTVLSGPAFQPRVRGTWQEWSIDEIVRFIAYDPLYFNPTQRSTIWTSPTCASFPYTFPFSLECPISFPITFPITFLVFGGEADIIAYTGTWKEFPKFVIRGPAQYIRLNNLTTGQLIFIDYALPSTRTMTIDLTYKAKTVTLDDGTNVIGYVSSSSDLGEFHLRPGNNSIYVEVQGAGSNTQVTLSYYERYIGI